MLFSELYKIMVKKVAFVGFRGRSPPLPPGSALGVRSQHSKHNGKMSTAVAPAQKGNPDLIGTYTAKSETKAVCCSVQRVVERGDGPGHPKQGGI